MIMKKTVELSAVAIMFSMMVGVSFPTVIHPILGILISVPLAGITDIFLKDVREWQRKKAHATQVVSS
jgi:predicted PurR-regulated permease PerM